VFTVPAKNGATRNITRTPGIHERDSKWSPDGKWIAYLSDASGEDEIYIEPQDGGGPPAQVTTSEDTYKYQIYWSPDSKKILWADKRLRLRYVDIENKAIKEVAQAKLWEFSNYCWSPDSKWIAYAKPEEQSLTKVYLYSLEKEEAYEVTDGWYSSSDPSFSSDGKYLFFVSDRDFNPTVGGVEFNYSYQDMARIYLVTLSKSVESPFKPKSDEVTIKEKKPQTEEKTEKKEEEKKEKKDSVVVVRVEQDGLRTELLGFPSKPPVIGTSNRSATTSII
jgi:tricorn protease